MLIQYDNYETETPDAWCLEIDGADYWFPKSICEIDEDDCTVEVPSWLVRKEGLESYEVWKGGNYK